MKEIRSYYELLRITPEATQEEVEHAYQQAIAHLREQIAGSTPPPPEVLDRLREAYLTLHNPQQRAIYDNEHKLSETPSQVAAAPANELGNRSGVSIIGTAILVISYGLLSVDVVLFCVSWFQPSFLSVVTIWAAMCIAPFIVVGHFMTSIGRKPAPNARAKQLKTNPETYSALNLAGLLLQLNAGLFILTLIPMFALWSLPSLHASLITYGVLAIIGFVAGAKLKRAVPWSKPTAAVISIASLTNFPIGSVLACVTLYFLAKGWNSAAQPQ